MPDRTEFNDAFRLCAEKLSLLGTWLTTADQSALLQRLPCEFQSGGYADDAPVINVDPGRKYQVMEGFGFALTGGSAMLISRLSDKDRAELLRELFQSGEDGIGISFLRLSIGASDLSERSFSCDDVPDGYTDPELEHFDIEAGDREVIPLLREILKLNPGIKIIATPWSAPPWMKSNRSFVGGKLRPDCYGVYAAYLIRYLEAMRERGIAIHAITPQNEPLNDKNEPSMVMDADEQALFIKDYLGPALRQARLVDTELFCFDHNCDMKEYPLTVFADAEARRYLSGSAWHLYGGDISALSEVHRAYPEMKLYFTEQWVGANGRFGDDLLWHVKQVLIGSIRNWSRAVLEWNLASDPSCGPHTLGGAHDCVGALTIGGSIDRNVAYYVIAHAAKFLRPGSVRIYSDELPSLPSVAFLTPEGCVVLIVLNDARISRSFAVEFQGKRSIAILPPRAVATYVWKADSHVK